MKLLDNFIDVRKQLFNYLNNLDNWINTPFDKETIKLLHKFKNIRQQIFDYFGYIEGNFVFPIEDATHYFWILNGNKINYANSNYNLINQTNHYYIDTMYNQKFLSKVIYRRSEYTMFIIDNKDNTLLKIFDNSKEL